MYDIKKDGNSILDGTKPVHMSADRGNKNSWKSKNLYTYLNDNGEYELVIIIKYDDDLLQNTIEFSIPTSN